MISCGSVRIQDGRTSSIATVGKIPLAKVRQYRRLDHAVRLGL